MEKSLNTFDKLNEKEKKKVRMSFLDLLDSDPSKAKAIYIQFFQLFNTDPLFKICKEEFEEKFKDTIVEMLLPQKVENFEQFIQFSSKEEDCVKLFQEICQMNPKTAYQLCQKFENEFNSSKKLQAIKDLNWDVLKKNSQPFSINNTFTLIEERGNIKFYCKSSDKDALHNLDVLNPMNTSQIKTLLVIGETGSGKSTLLNSMVTYLLGINLYDNVRIKMIVEKNEKKQTISQTTEVNDYIIIPKESRFPYPIRFIDTPGFGDTRGIEFDKKNAEYIWAYIKKAKMELHGICFVIKASTNRMTAVQKYIFQQILGLFGNDVKENFFGMVTFADNEKPLAFEALEIEKVPVSAQRRFKFNNSAFFPSISKDSDLELTSLFWKMGVANFKKFFDVLLTITPSSLEMTKEVIKTREGLEIKAKAIQDSINEGLIERRNLDYQFEMFSKNFDEINRNKDFVFDECYTEKKQTFTVPGQPTTNCINCGYEACHQNCGIADNTQKANCAVMDKNGYCVKCPGRCHWSKHFNLSYYFTSVQKTRKTKLIETEARYNQGMQNMSRAEAALKALGERINAITARVLNNINQCQNFFQKLNEIALRPIPKDVSEYMDMMIEVENNEKKEGYAERIKQIEKVRDQNKLLNANKVNDLLETQKVTNMMKEVERKTQNLNSQKGK